MPVTVSHRVNVAIGCGCVGYNHKPEVSEFGIFQFTGKVPGDTDFAADNFIMLALRYPLYDIMPRLLTWIPLVSVCKLKVSVCKLKVSVCGLATRAETPFYY